LKNKAVPEGTTAGMCAKGAKELAQAKWADYVTAGYVTLCTGDACTNWNGEALKPVGGKAPESGKCSDFKCPAPKFVAKKAVAAKALCTTAAECEFNCCDVDINAQKNEKS
jgi:hypothetical protein